MLKTFGSIPSRFIAPILVLVITFAPALAAGVADDCGLQHTRVQVQEHDDCCHGGLATPDAEQLADPGYPQGPERPCCPRCMHACCRAADVVYRHAVDFPDDRLPVGPILPVTELHHDPVTCDAVFHPPRA
jgi:hypothetical protein